MVIVRLGVIIDKLSADYLFLINIVKAL